MCDALGPPLSARPFQHYQVWRGRQFTYVFGVDKVLREYSVLRIPRREDPAAELELLDGEERFPLQRLEAHRQELHGRDGGLRKVAAASAILGFIRFLHGPYLILVTRHKKVGKIGHHYVLAIEATTLVELLAEGVKPAREEKAFVDQFYTLNLSKDFYFSYSYELSRTAQQNFADARLAAAGEQRRPLLLERDAQRHHRFVWNRHHLTPLLEREGWQHWCLSVIHGFFAYTKCSSFGWNFEIALIARRSRFHAGTRYRKRGLNVDGQVANDVETEQLLCDDATRHLARGHVMSFVQVRGSVPLFWAQEATTLNPKPPVVYPRCDPTLSATRRHFADLLERYGTPLLVVNLMKARKPDSHEVRLSRHFESAIERVNRELPPALRVLYRPFDMKNHARAGPVFEVFARLAESVVGRVGFFHACHGAQGRPERTQSGVVRTNCMDCLDRTNVLQFFVGLEVLQQQLTALGLLPEPRLDFDSQVVFVLQELYDLMGDHLALQYAGSVAHKKNPLLGSRPRMMTSTKELLTSIHRHYNNSYRDNEKQAGMNFFLGVYRPSEHPRLRDLDCDSWVHHRVLRDSYDPGDWWEAPLARFSQSMQACTREPAALALAPAHSRQWFRVVHSVWKFTWFEKLLSHLEATFVQINASSRRLSTLRPCKTVAQGRPGRRAPAATPAEATPGQPRPVDPADLEAYRAYADPRRSGHLGRAAGSGLELAELGSAGFALARREAPAEAPAAGARGPELQHLLGCHLQRAPRGRRGQAPRHADKADKSERDEARRRLRQVLEAHAQLCEAGDRQWREQAAAPPRREALGAEPGEGAQQWQRSERLRLCSYCGEAYGAPGAEDERAAAPGEGPARPRLCRRHAQRARELEELWQSGSLDLPVWGACAGDRGRRSPAAGRQRHAGQRPWEGWPRARHEQPASPPGPAASLASLAPSSRLSQRHASRGSVASMASGAHDGPAVPGAAVAQPAAAFGLAAAAPRTPVRGAPAEGRQGEGPGVRRRDATFSAASEALRTRPGGATAGSPPARPPAAAAGGPAGGPPADEWARQQLWAYAFPHGAPAPADSGALGLPAWWLEALEAPPSAPRDTATLPLALRSRRHDARLATRRRSALASHARAASLGAPGPPQRDAGAGEPRRSIWAEAMRQLLDEPVA